MIIIRSKASHRAGFSFAGDIAGNRTQEQVTIGMTTTTTNWTYNHANQISTMQIGSNPITHFTYDANGNMMSDGVNTYTWDKANRMATLNDGVDIYSYAYDGIGHRVSQTVNSTVTQYLLDVQPGYGIFDLSTNSDIPSIEFTSSTDLLVISPLGKYFATPSGVFSIEDGQKLIDTEHIDQLEFRFAPDDTSVVILPTLELYTLEPVSLISESLIGFRDYHANGRYISTSTQLLQANDLSVVFSWQEQRGHKIFDKSGRFMAVADDAVYNLETGEKLFAIAGNPWRFSVNSDYLDIGYLTSPHAIYRMSDGKRHEGLEPLYTEFGLLQVGQVVLVVQEDTLQTPIKIIQFKPEIGLPPIFRLIRTLCDENRVSYTR